MDIQLLPYRLKSARRKKRLQKEDRDKQLLALDRERHRIRKDPEYMTTVPLDEPYQKGWKRMVVLKPGVQRSDKAQFYQEILNVINQVQYHYDASFKKPKRKGHWHKYYFDELPKLHAIDSYNWYHNKNKLSEEQRACFTRVDFWSEYRYQWDYRYEFTMPELFDIAVKPHIIDTIKIGDAILEQQLAWIDCHIDNNYLECRLQKLHKGGYNNQWKKSFERLKYRNPLKNKAKCVWTEE
jgi:hypothetical protein